MPSVSDSSANSEPGGACCYGRGVRHVPFSSTESMAEDFEYLGSKIGAGFIDFIFFFHELISTLYEVVKFIR